MPHKFEMGNVVATPGALEALESAGVHAYELLYRHVSGDWGEVDAHDAAENDFALGKQLRIVSAYTLNTGVTVWIISEADRSSTCLLLPSEY